MAAQTRVKLAGAAQVPGLDHAAALWALIALELLAMAHLRNMFRRHHGG